MKFADLIGMPDVVRFALRQLDRIDITKIESIIMSQEQTDNIWDGECKPLESGLYRIRCGTAFGLEFPIHGLRCTICWGRAPLDGKPCPKCKVVRTYELKSDEEVMVYMFGHEIFHYLVFTGQRKSTEKTEEQRADDNGADWVRRWRSGRH